MADQLEHLSEIICSVSETDPKEVLREARQLVKSEQYAAALEKYIWFHDHALDADRALAGVRLSYASWSGSIWGRSIHPLGGR